MTHIRTPRLKILGLSENELALMPDVPFALISVTSPGCHHVSALAKANPCMLLKFDDAENRPGWTWDGARLFTREDAESIVLFVDSLEDGSVLVVNCQMGISRSQAIVAAIAYCQGSDDLPIWEKSCPNQYVFGHLCLAFGKIPPKREWHNETGVVLQPDQVADESELLAVIG